MPWQACRGNFGNSDNFYVAPGITSSLSKAMQIGGLQIVMSDSDGFLATQHYLSTLISGAPTSIPSRCAVLLGGAAASVAAGSLAEEA
jgi:hypothetical protein